MTHPALLRRLLRDDKHTSAPSTFNSVPTFCGSISADDKFAGPFVTFGGAKCNGLSGWDIRDGWESRRRDIETRCKILKQVADKNHYVPDRSQSGMSDELMSKNFEHRTHVRIGLSESEAKFFLDRKKLCSYHDHKFLGDFSARAKFHLHGLGKVVNCCSHFWGGVGASAAGCESTRFRKAEIGKLANARYSIRYKRSFREDQPRGACRVSGNREESELIMNTGMWIRGGKGEASIV